MNPRNTLILLVILVVLVGFVYFTEPGVLGKAAATATPQPGQAQVLKLDTAKVNHLTVEDLGQKATTELAKQGATWRLAKPVSDEADSTAVDYAVSQLADLKATRTFTGTEADLSAFGLVTGTYSITLGVEGSADQKLKVGDKDPTGEGFYVEKDGDAAVYFVSAANIEQVLSYTASPPLKPTPEPTLPPATAEPPTSAAPANPTPAPPGATATP